MYFKLIHILKYKYMFHKMFIDINFKYINIYKYQFKYINTFKLIYQYID